MSRSGVAGNRRGFPSSLALPRGFVHSTRSRTHAETPFRGQNPQYYHACCLIVIIICLFGYNIILYERCCNGKRESPCLPKSVLREETRCCLIHVCSQRRMRVLEMIWWNRRTTYTFAYWWLSESMTHQVVEPDSEIIDWLSPRN